MILYDSQIKAFRDLLTELPVPQCEAPWPDGGTNQMIFREETACELGGANLPALGGTLVTSGYDLVEDGVYLLGPDIPALPKNSPYARVALVRVREDAMGEGNALHKAIRKTEYTRYHVSPQGFQPGISTGTKRETARISLQAQKQGLTFGHVGNAFREAYLQHPWVERVQIIFITAPEFDYRKLSSLLDQSENITKALDHLLQKVKMDCNTCHLKEICAEVEELCAADAPQIAEAVASRYQ